ncbi:MAG: tetratricopeptide repeat protein [Bacteroidales bacterium]|nr:tetratricopeptide repeat protein [Bacteroidales bacterium]
MKKLALAIITGTFAILTMTNSSVQAQKKYVNRAAVWAEKGVKLDTALGSVIYCESQEKTKNWYKTYYAKGLIYNAVAQTENEDFKKLSSQPLIDAYKNFAKAYNMKGSGSIKAAVDMKFINLANLLVNTAVEAYNKEDFESAYNYFETSLELKKQKVFNNVIDTAIIYNVAFLAQKIGKFDKAIEYYSKAIELSYGAGDSYVLLANVYKEKGDNDMYIKTLQKGFETYPANQSLLANLINYYLLEVENSDEAFKYLAVAREKDPNNPQFYSSEAHLYEKIGKLEQAKEKYLKAIELDSNFFEAYYNLGVLFFNEGVALTDKAIEISDNTEYEKAKKIADDEFAKAVPYIEKAYELNPEENSIKSTLKTLYYRLKMTEKYEALTKE